LGGDEFVAVLQNLEHPDASTPVLERLLQAAAEPVQLDELELAVSASIGVVFYPQQESLDADQLQRQADQAMYQAKQAGKNRYHLFDVERDRAVRDQHESLERIRDALYSEEFRLFYQPKVNMRTGEVIGCEALIRWQHPERGLLPPAAFLPVIENHPLAIELGHWVLCTALDQQVSWKQAGMRLQVSINIDAIHLQHASFVERLDKELQQRPTIQPGDLELEILETTALDDVVQISDIITACQRLGVGFALDDFGTGYSSLTYLKRLPAELLKIDRSFVRDMLDDPDDLAILDGVIRLAQAFRRSVIAEGVETQAHCQALLELGCELGQGYAIARPMPEDELPTWLLKWSEQWQTEAETESAQ
jgi:EAL domain-containing protein (putative c-di-GMP-specific phosphodiesterase class I)